jgi:hypothetical protein
VQLEDRQIIRRSLDLTSAHRGVNWVEPVVLASTRTRFGAWCSG